MAANDLPPYPPAIAEAIARHPFPPPSRWPRHRPLAIGGEMSVGRLLAAYAQGIFPWTSDPAEWWSPDPRCILLPSMLTVPDSLRRTARKPQWEVRYDTAFAEVIAACAAQPRPGQDGTWITPTIQAAYGELHAAGYAHSIECWRAGELVGGFYGVGLGGLFCGESMFFRVPDASKVAFARFVAEAPARGIELIDCQQPTDHLLRFGATVVTRDSFREAVRELVCRPRPPGLWR